MNSPSARSHCVLLAWQIGSRWIGLAAVALAGCSTISSQQSAGPLAHPKSAPSLAAAGSATPFDAEIPVAAPSPANPVISAMRVEPSTVHPGDTFAVLVRVRIAGAHHIYATSVAGKPFLPTTLKLTLPKEIEALGDWEAPEPTRTNTGDLVYTDSVLFRRSLRVRSNARAGSIPLEGELSCQACNEELCWPPSKLPLSTSLTIRANSKPLP